VETEIRTYNSRYLDIVLRLPGMYAAWEDKLKTLIAGTIARGRTEVRLIVNDTSPAADAFEVNTQRARAYWQALEQLKEQLQLEQDTGFETLLSAGDMVKPAERQIDLEQGWPVAETCLQKALDELDFMRRKEGAFLADDISRRLEGIAAHLSDIRAASSGMLEHYQQRLKDRIGKLTDGVVEIDESRIAQEAALLADRSDISEELVRSASHLDQFRTIMDAEAPAGRKLNFMLQELHREFNTMGAKTEKAAVSHTIVEIKTELEKIREQVQNIE
jgi:uncharacterized protein (TIGR00255 family)